MLNKVSNKVIVDFSKEMLVYLMKLEYSLFKKNSELIMNSFNKTLQALERLNRFVLTNVMSNVIEIIIISIMLHSMLGPKYFLNTIITYSIYLIATRKISNYRQTFIKDKFKAELHSESKLYDIVHNIETVKYFQREETESVKFSKIILGVREKDQKVINSLSFLNGTQSLIITAGMVLNLTMGVIDCVHGVLTPGDLVMMQAVFTQMMIPLNFMGMLMREIDEAKVNLKYGVDMINEKNTRVNPPSTDVKQFHFHGGKIEFKDVHFSFNERHKILNNFNIVFEPGTINGIVGQSGQGKSTLFNLLYCLYLPNQGSIYVDDQDINQVEVDSYRKVSLVLVKHLALDNLSAERSSV